MQKAGQHLDLMLWFHQPGIHRVTPQYHSQAGDLPVLVFAGTLDSSCMDAVGSR